MIGIVYSGISLFFTLLIWAIIINALMSWFIPPGSSGFSRLLGNIVDPILYPFSQLQQRLFPNSPIDFSPLFALLVIEFLKNSILRIF